MLEDGSDNVTLDSSSIESDEVVETSDDEDRVEKAEIKTENINAVAGESDSSQGFQSVNNESTFSIQKSYSSESVIQNSIEVEEEIIQDIQSLFHFESDGMDSSSSGSFDDESEDATSSSDTTNDSCSIHSNNHDINGRKESIHENDILNSIRLLWNT